MVSWRAGDAEVGSVEGVGAGLLACQAGHTVALAAAMRARASSSAKCGFHRMNSAIVMSTRSCSKAASYVADAGAPAVAGLCFLFMAGPSMQDWMR